VLREKTLQRAEEQAQMRLRRDQENWKERVAAITSDNDATWQRYERKKAEQLTSEDYLAYTQAADHWAMIAFLAGLAETGSTARARVRCSPYSMAARQSEFRNCR
jgi:hypothetical protein